MTALELAVPQGVVLINASVDFQIDRAELEFVGWGEGEETWGLGYVILPGDYSVLYSKGRPWAYDQIEGLLTRRFTREDGAKLEVCCAAFDTGFSTTLRPLTQYLRPRFGRHYYPTKGSNQRWDPIWRQGRREDRMRLYIVGTNRAKQLWYRRATISTPGPGYMHIPKTDDYSEEWFKQFLAEDSYTVRDKGVEMQIFEMPSSPKPDGSSHNEALDIRVGALAALHIFGPVNWEQREKKNLATIPAKEKTQSKPRQERDRSDWMGGMGSGFRV